MMFEVLETSWGTLQENLDSALTLDDLIEAHKAYVRGILARALLNEESTEVKNTLEEVCMYVCRRGPLGNNVVFFVHVEGACTCFLATFTISWSFRVRAVCQNQQHAGPGHHHRLLPAPGKSRHPRHGRGHHPKVRGSMTRRGYG